MTILRFAFGFLLGIFFYGGLWLTVRRLAVTRHPFALTLGSLMLRMAVTLAGFIAIIDGRWQNAVVALAGFTAARVVVSLIAKPTGASAADRGVRPTCT